jgi:hypothetical protein
MINFLFLFAHKEKGNEDRYMVLIFARCLVQEI